MFSEVNAVTVTCHPTYH